MPRLNPLLNGSRFGRLLYNGESRSFSRGEKALFHCDCGNTKRIEPSKVRSRHTQSCGCVQRTRAKEANVKHGHCKKTPEYCAWQNMKTRCYNPHYFLFQDYGGRGISVCPEWRNDFGAFLTSVGPRPSASHSIDRIDGNGNYEPANVRWATRTEQSRNRRSVKPLTVGDLSMTLPEWESATGIPRKKIWRRLKAGWSAERAVSHTERAAA